MVAMHPKFVLLLVIFLTFTSYLIGCSSVDSDYTDLSDAESGIAIDSIPIENDTKTQKKKKRLRRLTGIINANDTRCSRRGNFEFGRCRCQYPYTGSKCLDFACEHGLSVGAHYDPESSVFNKKCICDHDWSGEYCNIPIADQCNGKGQYIDGHCRCLDFYFGESCQYVGQCVNGRLSEGICKCDYGWEGDYCHHIACHHGYTSAELNYTKCVCPPRHTGQFCDECKLTGLHILPFPNCTLEIVPSHARLTREKTDGQLMSRISIIGVAAGILVVLVFIMWILHWGRKRNSTEAGSRRSLSESPPEDVKELIDLGIFVRQKSREVKIHKNGFHEIDCHTNHDNNIQIKIKTTELHNRLKRLVTSHKVFDVWIKKSYYYYCFNEMSCQLFSIVCWLFKLQTVLENDYARSGKHHRCPGTGLRIEAH
uniref:EGF-like domain-containing protein n=1 Tax=Panagrolaimus sp. JU765 TaxID=591449 RepID=A0AC34Q5N4_9BILA